VTTQETKDPVTLDGLKRAIAEYQKAKAAYASNCSLGWDIADARADAWLTAFEWHRQLISRHATLSETVGAHITDFIALDREEEEGMALIKEKLS
jgi:hypothetical protein